MNVELVTKLKAAGYAYAPCSLHKQGQGRAKSTGSMVQYLQLSLCGKLGYGLSIKTNWSVKVKDNFFLNPSRFCNKTRHFV